MHDGPEARQGQPRLFAAGEVRTPAQRGLGGTLGPPMPHFDEPNEPNSGEQLARALRNVHRGVLATLAVCAMVIMSQPALENAAPPPRLSAAGIGLAIAVIFMRALSRSTVMDPKRRVFFALGSLLTAAALGLLGVAAAWSEGTRQIGLGFALGAAILVLRPPPVTSESPDT